MRCLVLGGAGFIGSHIADGLLSSGYTVRIFDRPNISLNNLNQCLDRIEVISGDFDNVNDVSAALQDIDIVVHLIGTTLPGPSNDNPIYDVESNVIGTLNLLKESVRLGIKKVIFASSGGTVYGVPTEIPIPETHSTHPLCSYGITKLTIEKYMALYRHLHNLDGIVLRLGNPYGERQRIDNVQGAVAVFLGRVLRHQPITIWGDGSVARDYFHIRDLVSAFIRVIESDTPSKLYNIGSGRACSLNELLTVIREVTGITPVVNYTASRKLDVPINCLDIRRAKQELGWEPLISLRDGIAMTWEWLKSAYPKPYGGL